jgi:1-deoxy-D-xylulose-5-phosphate reductoisomerase
VATGTRRIALLGATGSIGRQALEVVDMHDDLRICALSSGSQPLDELAARYGVDHFQLGGDLTQLLDASEPDLVLNAVVGFAGVGATLWALERGVTLALANKESLVAAGDLAVAAWKRGAGLLLPVDSEHSAVLQCLEGRAPETVHSLVLTASGGPFRNRPLPDLESVSVEEALAHPTWSMGRKITVDSATLANKGLELIEAHYLFGLEYERIEVVVHPASVVHGLVRFRDGAALAHLGYPDMRVPISFALTYPDRRATRVAALDLSTPLSLEFEPPDPERFPLLPLAREAGERGGTYPCAFNAANEVAVDAFLDERIGFLEIAPIVEDALGRVDGAVARDLPELVEADAEARRLAKDRARQASLLRA